MSKDESFRDLKDKAVPILTVSKGSFRYGMFFSGGEGALLS